MRLRSYAFPLCLLSKRYGQCTQNMFRVIQTGALLVLKRFLNTLITIMVVYNSCSMMSNVRLFFLLLPVQAKNHSNANSKAATGVSPTVRTARSILTCTRPTSRTTAKCEAATNRTRTHLRCANTWKCTARVLLRPAPITTRTTTTATAIPRRQRRRRPHLRLQHRPQLIYNSNIKPT